MNPYQLHHFLLLARTEDVAVLTGWVVPLGIVAIAYYFAYHRNKMAHETLRKLIDKGQPITPELIAALKLKGYNTADIKVGGKIGISNRSRRDLRSGIVLVGIGIGIVMFIGKAGCVVLFLGVAFLILSFMDRTEDSQQPSANVFDQVFHPKTEVPNPAQPSQPPQPQAAPQPPPQPPVSTDQPQ